MIDPAGHVVVVTLSNWPTATSREHAVKCAALMAEIVKVAGKQGEFGAPIRSARMARWGAGCDLKRVSQSTRIRNPVS